jgi:phospholipid/cholesterol/gamma-HCH transport system substrate-binding protein
MVTQAPRRSAVLVAIAFTLSCLGLIVFVWTQFGGTIPFAPQGYQVRAVFPETGLLVSGADVRISGVNIGRVTGVSRRGVSSLVTMDIQQGYSPIPADTRAILRQKTLLGEAFIELTPGSRRARTLPDGGMLPASQVARTTQLDQILGSFGKPTQQDLSEFLSGSAASLAGQAENLSSALGNLDPAVTELRAVVLALNGDRGNLASLLHNGATVVHTLGQRSADLEGLINSGEQVFSATAQRNRALSATVDRLPPFLARLRVTLNAIGHTLDLASPSVSSLQSSAPLLRPALSDVISLSGPALTLLHQAPRLISDALVALPAVARFNDAFHPTLDALLPAVRQITPVIRFIGLYRKELVTAMANLAASLEAQASAHTNGYPDAPGSASYLRSLAIVGNETPFGQSVREPTSRVNPYFSPGELTNLARGGLQAATCANTGNPSQSHLPFGNVPCRVQPGFAWNRLVRYYPHLAAGSRP